MLCFAFFVSGLNQKLSGPEFANVKAINFVGMHSKWEFDVYFECIFNQIIGENNEFFKLIEKMI